MQLIEEKTNQKFYAGGFISILKETLTMPL
jgi:hypothetical protein